MEVKKEEEERETPKIENFVITDEIIPESLPPQERLENMRIVRNQHLQLFILLKQ